MTEYTVVLFFGVMTLTSGYMGDAVGQLTDVIKKNYQGYTFAISMSEPPDFDSAADQQTAWADPANGRSSEESDRLAGASAASLYTDLKTYNKDPLKQIKSGINSLKNCVSQIKPSFKKPVNCP